MIANAGYVFVSRLSAYLFVLAQTSQVAKPFFPAEILNHPHPYKYDLSSGKCMNSDKQVGYNDLVLERVRGTKDAECMDLTGLELLSLDIVITEKNRFAYYELKNWNFRGSNLNNAELFFNLIIDADLRGASFSELKFGYASVTGRVDQFSVIPDDCEQFDQEIRCGR